MGEARRRRLRGLAMGTKIEPNVDVDAAIADFERHIEADNVVGFLQIGLLRRVAPGVSPVKMWTMGIEKQDAYDMLCIMKTAMEETLGFKEDD